MDNIKLGSFEVVSGKIIMSDPCYDLHENESINKIIKVLNGTWDAYIVKPYGAINKLFIHHNSISLKDIYLELDYDCNKFPVDSGQFGFFDLDNFKNNDNTMDHKLATFIDQEEGKWYAM